MHVIAITYELDVDTCDAAATADTSLWGLTSADVTSRREQGECWPLGDVDIAEGKRKGRIEAYIVYKGGKY